MMACGAIERIDIGQRRPAPDGPGFTDIDGSQPDAWKYVVEVQDAGKPADVTGYR
jgi:hypothetical protein